MKKEVVVVICLTMGEEVVVVVLAVAEASFRGFLKLISICMEIQKITKTSRRRRRRRHFWLRTVAIVTIGLVVILQEEDLEKREDVERLVEKR